MPTPHISEWTAETEAAYGFWISARVELTPNFRLRDGPTSTWMRAMLLDRPEQPLRATALLLRLLVQACGVGRTDLHVVDGELAEPKLPLIPSNEIVGGVVEKGARVEPV
jgi:hypothetical protein